MRYWAAAANFSTNSSNVNCEANCSAGIPALWENSTLSTFMVILIWDDKLKYPEIRPNEKPVQQRIGSDRMNCVVRCDGTSCTTMLSEQQVQHKNQQSYKSEGLWSNTALSWGWTEPNQGTPVQL